MVSRIESDNLAIFRDAVDGEAVRAVCAASEGYLREVGGEIGLSKRFSIDRIYCEIRYEMFSSWRYYESKKVYVAIYSKDGKKLATFRKFCGIDNAVVFRAWHLQPNLSTDLRSLASSLNKAMSAHKLRRRNLAKKRLVGR